jgi:peroxiredoxin
MSASVPAIGTPAPDFTLDTTAGSTVTLSSYKGKQNVLLAFFPLAFTSTCTAELCAFSDDYSAFAGKDVTVIPISVDAVPSLKEFKAKYSMGVELASDFKRTASRAYDVLHPERYFSQRGLLPDRQGGHGALVLCRGDAGHQAGERRDPGRDREAELTGGG